MHARSTYGKGKGKGKGTFCEGATKEVEACNPCDAERSTTPVDCKFSEWSKWASPSGQGECSVPCGGGIAERSREVTVEPKNGGKVCFGALEETRGCIVEPCAGPTKAKDCNWNEWHDWGACDKCGGERKRNRVITQMPDEGGAICELRAAEEVGACPRLCHLPSFCQWSEWEVDGSCSSTCGAGSIQKTRTLEPVLLASTDSSRRLSDRFKVNEVGSCRGKQDQYFPCDKLSLLQHLRAPELRPHRVERVGQM
jgi:hypothetical protein